MPVIPLPPQVVYICKPTLVERRIEPKPCVLVNLGCNSEGLCQLEELPLLSRTSSVEEAPEIKIVIPEKEE